MKYKNFLGAFLLAVALLSYNNCSEPSSTGQGSILGNSEKSTNVGNPVQLAHVVITQTICNLLVYCNYELTLEACEQGLLATPGIGEAMGVQPNVYLTFSDVAMAEDSGSLSVTASSLQTCSSGIQALNCFSPEVRAAYNIKLSNPFEEVPKLFSTSSGSCPAIYTSNLGTK